MNSIVDVNGNLAINGYQRYVGFAYAGLTASDVPGWHTDPSDPWFHFYWPYAGEYPGGWWPYDDRNNPTVAYIPSSGQPVPVGTPGSVNAPGATGVITPTQQTTVNQSTIPSQSPTNTIPNIPSNPVGPPGGPNPGLQTVGGPGLGTLLVIGGLLWFLSGR